ncbi:MAG TPA: histidine kinase [Chloroflexota bacterium]
MPATPPIAEHVAAPRRHASSGIELALAVLPHLRGGLTAESAAWTARLLLEHLATDAAAVVDTETTLAFVGAGSDHHAAGEPIRTALTRQALLTGEPIAARGRRRIGCREPGCPLSAALVLPLRVQQRTVGALKLYRVGSSRGVPAGAARAALGLARLFGVYLELAELDARSARVTRAELEALRAQISPHFLFNTLTTIAALIRSQPAVAHDLIIEFAEFFRETLAQHGELCSLNDDLAYVEHYLTFERARLGERLQVNYDIEPAARRAMLPVLVVQPLVENAIIHGLEGRPQAGQVTISAHREGDGFCIRVVDDGVGIAPDRRLQVLAHGYGTGLGMGLSNVHGRLQSLFGPAAGLHIDSALGRGTRVSFWVPDRVDRGARR